MSKCLPVGNNLRKGLKVPSMIREGRQLELEVVGHFVPTSQKMQVKPGYNVSRPTYTHTKHQHFPSFTVPAGRDVVLNRWSDTPRFFLINKCLSPLTSQKSWPVFLVPGPWQLLSDPQDILD